MYEKAEVCRNKCAGEKPTTCVIKACIYMCEGKKRTHAYACYGHACTAQCTCNVVCMCGKKHAQESGNNDNNDIKSSKIIRFKKYGWDKMKSTHRYAWYGRACTAPCTYNVVCMCGKIHAQESEKIIIISQIK